MHLAVAASLAAATQFGATRASADLSFANRFVDSISDTVASINPFGRSDEAEKSGLPAVGENFRLYETSGDWYIFVNDTTGLCLAEKFDANLNAVQFGKTQDADEAFIAVYAQLPEEYRQGSQRTTLVVGDMTKTGKLSKRQRVGQAYTGAYLKAPNYDFITGAPYATSIVKMGRTEIETTISLDGSTEALQATLDCNAAQGV
ncbi:hypothetical protein ATO3_09455 [Marinibacterium profundimaris]|uniref:Uncharacterized protein n=2 Tax=Marinibacterium profundimaris TaxID=1679460 RepID=A0A225NQR2_9RHOB|nr:hypothetical protein ATO3_09455 [Marinibacterium profundimaris]